VSPYFIIKEKYARKTKHIFPKKTEIRNKISKQIKRLDWQKLEEKGHYYEQKVILSKLNRLTNLIEKLERKIRKIERKLTKLNSAK